MTEIDRILFVTLNTDKFGYYILNDGNFVMKFFAESDDEAIKKFHAILDIKNAWNFSFHDDFELEGDILTVLPSDYEDNDIAITIWQIDIFSGEHRHKGITEGCIWTEWED